MADRINQTEKLSAAVPALSFLCGLLVVALPTNGAAHFSVVYTFTGEYGEYPEAGLSVDPSGDQNVMYSTTFGSLGSGEPIKNCAKGCGNEYAIMQGQIIQSNFFTAGPGPAFPTGEVVVQKGDIYGTTELGGGTACDGLGCGTAFRFPSGSNTPVYLAFCRPSDFPSCAHGAFPHAGLVLGGDGNLYGTTTLGGAAEGYACDNNFGGCGTVYTLPTNFTNDTVPDILYSFCKQAPCVDGAMPLGKVWRDDASGTLYGTTQFGGESGLGTIFELSPKGTETVLYSFCKQSNCADGAIPEASLISDTAGNLYGSASAGGGGTCSGSISGCGVVFKIALANHKYTVLHSFKGGSDGALPQAQLVLDPNAHILYGTTLKGGGGAHCTDPVIGCGTVFRLPQAGGKETKLHTFGNNPTRYDGAQPEGALLLLNGSLYGATRVEGKKSVGCDCGTLFQITTGEN